MDWLKKNAFFIGWGALAAFLTLVAFYFLYAQINKNAELQQAVEARQAELNRILRADPQPNTTNIAALKLDQQKAEQWVADAQKFFSVPPSMRLDSAGFRKLLEDSVFQLHRDAEAARVGLPTNYSFSFASQRNAVQFSPGSIEPLVARLEDIKMIARILFQARVHSVEHIRRVSVASDDSVSSTEVLTTSAPITNAATGAVSYPYEISMSCFTRELALVMDSLIKGPPFAIIKNIAVEPAPTMATPGAPGQPPGPPRPANPDDVVDDTEPKPPQPAFAAPIFGARPVARPATWPQTILDQKLLRVTLLVHVLAPPIPAVATAK